MTATVFSLVVPAEPGAVRVIRSVASGAAAEADLAYDSLDDLGLAIDEAGSALLSHGGVGGALRCELSSVGSVLDVTMSASSPKQGVDWPSPDWQESLEAMVLMAVAGSVSFTRVGGNPAVSFTIGN